MTGTQWCLAREAEAIRVIGRRSIADIIEIGRRLSECKERLGHGNWLPWLEREFGWSVDTAHNFMNVSKMAGKFGTVPNLDIDARSLYLLAAPSTPAAAIDAVLADGVVAREEIERLVAEAVAAARPTLPSFAAFAALGVGRSLS